MNGRVFSGTSGIPTRHGSYAPGKFFLQALLSSDAAVVIDRRHLPFMKGTSPMNSRIAGLAVSFALITASVRAAESPTTPASTSAQRYGTWGVDLAGMDRSIRP